MMRWMSGGVTAARGFAASGVAAGIKPSRRPDLALVMSRDPAAAAAVFTTNRIKAAPVVISQQRLRRGKARAVLLNSGCANCLTGEAGLRDALRLSTLIAQGSGLADHEVLLASTGLIGSRLPVARVERAIPRLLGSLNRQQHEEAAWAILTTDHRPKEAAVRVAVRGGMFHVGGMAKGSGMIAPSMATMLCVITTDVAAPPQLLRRLLRQASATTFNRISVDGDMSTNDTVFLLANGRSGVQLRPGAASVPAFAGALQAVAERLARMIVVDGEGASRVMEVVVSGARTAREAHLCARTVAVSPLVKTMLAGGDPNPGRLAAAVGASPARFDPGALEIRIQGRLVVANGRMAPLPASVVKTLLRRPEVLVRIDLHAGRAAGRMTTCDLTTDYVRINAGYAT